MIGAGGGGPVTEFLVQAGQEARGINGVGVRFGHLGQRGEGPPVPAVIDLEAAQIEAFPATGKEPAGGVEKLRAAGEPAPRAGEICRPRPGREPAGARAPRLGEGDGAEDVERDPGACRGSARCRLAEMRGGRGRIRRGGRAGGHRTGGEEGRSKCGDASDPQ